MKQNASSLKRNSYATKKTPLPAPPPVPYPSLFGFARQPFYSIEGRTLKVIHTGLLLPS